MAGLRVDPEDEHLLAKCMWRFDTGYVRGGHRGFRLHNLILNPPRGFIVDHINGDTLDNRRCNLRIASKAQNARNARKRKKSSSPFKGVHKTVDRWMARITFEGTTHYLGHFNTQEEAAVAYDTAALKYFGEFARLNFPKKSA
jgi:hypothetical protein